MCSSSLLGLYELVGGHPLLRLPLGVLGGLTGEALALAEVDVASMRLSSSRSATEPRRTLPGGLPVDASSSS